MRSPSISSSLQKRRKRRLDRRGVQECFCPCNHVVLGVTLSLVSLWLCLLHKVISYDPNQSDARISLDALALPDPLYPPDMMDPQITSSSSIGRNNNHATSTPIMLTWQSNQHAHNQDRAVYYPTFPTRQVARPHDEPSFLVGLFDGHGRDGHLMADFVQLHLPQLLADKLNAQPCCQSDAWIQAQFNDTFFEIEQQAVALSPARDFAYTGGCTASVTLRLGNRLFFANTGDSRTMLASDFGSTDKPDDPYTATISYSTRLDKADLPDERTRIQAMGGTIHTPPVQREGSFQPPSRVVVYSQYLHDRVALAMSRSLGDYEWTAVGVTPEPLVDVVRLDDKSDKRRLVDPYLIVASDGLWDCRARRPQFFAKQIGAILFDKINNNHNDPTDGTSRAMSQLVDLVKKVTPQNPEWYRDDITVIAFRL